jgi:hypothetical protein
MNITDSLCRIFERYSSGQLTDRSHFQSMEKEIRGLAGGGEKKKAVILS